MANKEPDVLVAGAGPVGLFTALSLARRGLGVRVVEEEWRAAGRSYALALHPDSLGLLREQGLADAVIAAAHRVDVLAFYDGAVRREERRLAGLDVPYPFVSTFSQHDFENLLAEALRQSGVEVEWSHRVSALDEDPGGLTVAIQRLEKTSTGYAVAGTEWSIHSTSRVRPRFVVGADGHRSTVRSLLQLDWESTGPSELYAVFEFTVEEGGPGHEARFTRDAVGTSAMWPLPGGRWRWSVPLADAGAPMWRTKSRLGATIGEHDGRQALVELLAERLPWFHGAPDEVFWATTVRFERRLASAFGRGRTWLAGDAAHAGAPLAVQSMNVGLREGSDLAGSISAVLSRHASLELLEAYGEASRAEWLKLGDQGVAPLLVPGIRSPAAS
jgi:2-polyprenyl-6-methoxyphenol hydroxylase-like FAD-dependent oxidoreductase